MIRSMLLVVVVKLVAAQGLFHPEIPKLWDDTEMASLELPLAGRVQVRHAPAQYYYKIPVRPNLKTYLIYRPDKEPPGYFEWLNRQEPQPAYDPKALKTRRDWINAGEKIFESAAEFTEVDHKFTDVRNMAWYSQTDMRVDRQGVLPYYRYVVREKGKVAVTFDSCASCHTRLLPDGTVVKGAQGSIAFGKSYAYWIENTTRHKLSDGARNELLPGYGAPWVLPDPIEPLASATLRDLAKHLRTLPSGVNPRQGTSVMFPPQIPDLIGLKDRLYLDHTGLQQHRSIADLMRYDAINNFIEEIANYGGFVPSTMTGNMPDPAKLSRASDMELYALALYLYSLSPPPNPNPADSLTRRGALVFQREGCGSCHPPPLYTNNMLTPVSGFRIPSEDRQKYRILNVVVGTDPALATKTRRGTGYYKVPSLQGVWYRGPFEHNGSVATLEDWFDPARLRDDYIPTGYRGYGNTPRAVKGHEFGLRIDREDKRALIAFLKTL